MRLRVLGIVLAGGKGTRLYPLTKERAKPAVPFGGKYRIIDFVLSNFINSGIHSIYVLTQFKSQSLLQHLSDGWQFGGLLKDQFIIPVPAQMRLAGETWYRGTADAIYQNANLIEQSAPHLVAIFGADHIYRMNISSMVEYHEHKRAEITVAAIPVDRRFASEFGVIETARDGQVIGFHEKRADAPTIPGDPDRVYASMGNYIFSTRTLLRELYADASREQSTHDFGRDILPSLVDRIDMFAYDFQTNQIPGEAAERGALLARRGDPRRLLRGPHGSARGEPRAESLQSPVAAPNRQLRRPARQVHLRRRRPARSGHRLHRVGWLHPVGRYGA